MYYEWNQNAETLTIYSEKKAVFTIGSDIVIVDDTEVKLAKALEYIDGIPNLQADIFCDVVGLNVEFGEFNIDLTSK